MNKIIGFKKSMLFNITDQSLRELSSFSVNITSIDNVIDETTYNEQMNSSSFSISKKDVLRRKETKDDYLTDFEKLSKKNIELSEIYATLSELIDRLQNNYILIKNHITTYSKYFQELGCDFRQVIVLFFNFFSYC